MRTKMRLGELLIASGLLTGEQLESALQGQRASGMKLGEYLIKQGICRESDVVDAVCRQTGIERYTPSRFPLNMSLSDRLPADVAQRTNAVPLLIRGDVLVVAMVDPLDIDSLDRLEIVTDREVEPVMCLRQEFTQLYAALYGHFNSMDGVMESITSSMSEHAAPTQDDLLIASETPKDELGQPDESTSARSGTPSRYASASTASSARRPHPRKTWAPPSFRASRFWRTWTFPSPACRRTGASR